MLKNKWKKNCVIFLASLFLTTNTFAAGEAQIIALLTAIKGIVYNILQTVNTFPSYFSNLSTMASSWLDTTDTNQPPIIAAVQPYMTNIGTALSSEITAQQTFSINATTSFLKMNNTQSFPINANDLTASVLWNQLIMKPLDKDKNKKMADYVQDYLMNLSASTYTMMQPNSSWIKQGGDGGKYASLYNTLSSIQSYNAYILGSLTEQSTFQATANALVGQATNPNWFVSIGSESLGLVLRHLLMYTSASFVELERLIQIQQQQVAAQAMTNSLLIIYDSETVGQVLYRSATTAGTGGAGLPSS